MRTRSVALLAVLTVLLSLASNAVRGSAASAASEPATLVPTFTSVSVYWSPEAGSSGRRADVAYRPAGTTTWQPGLPLSFDGRELAERPQEYRGSIVGLTAGTTYDVRLTLAGTSAPVVQQVTTWTEEFPIGERIELPATSHEPVELREVGSPDGYVLVTGPGGGPATIDVQHDHDHALRLSGSAYVIVRGLTLKGAEHHGLVLGADADDDVHDIVLEGNDISGWGTGDGSGFGTNLDSAVYSESAKLTRLVVQGNRIHSPATTANSWEQSHNGSHHPEGPQGISLRRSAGNNVIRYNDIVGDDTHHFNDGMGTTSNFSHEGFPGPDSDIHGNYVAYTWDDGIEAEGGGMNVRIHSNYLTEVYHAFGLAPVSLGPLYAYRNVQDVARSDASASYGQAMFKMGGNTHKGVFYGDGRVHLFHNTALDPLDGPQNRKAIEAGHGRVLRNAVTRNNILQTGSPSGTPSISDDGRSSSNDFDHDLYNGLLRAGEGAQEDGVRGVPEHITGWGMDPATRTGSFSLADGSPGWDRGVEVPGFTGGWTGAAPDMGAQEAGTPPVVYGAPALEAQRAALMAPADPASDADALIDRPDAEQSAG